ncbi:MAG: sorbosone dehydrogenase family protein [Steroidobacteraceae bacterium]
MSSQNFRMTLIPLLGVALVACSGGSPGTLEGGIGPNPALPQPVSSLIPTMQVAPAIGWRSGATPRGFPGTAVGLFAGGLVHPRWIYVLPNGDVLVAESNAPAEGGAEMKGIRAFFMKRAQKKAGAATPSADRITLLRDADGDGKAELRTTFLANLHSPFGMALVGTDFYVANADSLMRFNYTPGATAATGTGVKVVDLPGGPMNHHWTKNVIASADGSRLYVTVGSNSNVGENGLEAERDRAAILEVDPSAGSYQIYASGLRNPNGLAWEPHTSMLWTAVNERDELGNNLVPDYMTSVQKGAFYGWPFSYFGQHVDVRVKPQRPDLVARAVVPDYALGAHAASIGLAYSAGNALPQPLSNGMFVGQHGSWNRKPPSGYKVIFIPFKDGKPAGEPLDVLTGFLNEKGEAHGRPVGVAFAADGALLVADDVGNGIWRVAATAKR